MKMTPADKAWAKAVKERDGWTCRRCGSKPDPRGLHAHHIFSRRWKAGRVDVENGVSLCFGHHVPWAHAYPLEFHEWIKGELGEEVYDALAARARGRRDRVA